MLLRVPYCTIFAVLMCVCFVSACSDVEEAVPSSSSLAGAGESADASESIGEGESADASESTGEGESADASESTGTGKSSAGSSLAGAGESADASESTGTGKSSAGSSLAGAGESTDASESTGTGKSSAGPVTGLSIFISEYIEGSSNNKYIELYNPNSTPFSLSGWSLKQYYDGAYVSNDSIYTMALAGSIPAKGVFVIRHNLATAWTGTADMVALPYEQNKTMSFGGDDPMGLYNGTELVDIVGTLGDSDDHIKDMTLVRKPGKGPDITFEFEDWYRYDSTPTTTVTNYLGSHTYADAGVSSTPSASSTPGVSSTSSVSSAPGVSSSGGGVPGTGFQENMSLPQNVRDYYRSAYGLSGSALKSQLKSIITSGHSGKGYNGLWTMYATSDVVPAGVANAGKLWDMYSNTSEDGSTAKYWYTVGGNQCGSYSGERSCYNREHSWPKSNFGGSTSNAPGTDGHHITPTDGYVNGRRSNWAYGEVGTATWTSENGGKLGPARSGLGFSGTVFEVIDIYKGDHARMHFYMSVRYYGDSLFQSGDWSNSGAKLKPWYNTMLRTWHANDAVSQKEITRNSAVHAHQGNRNPFIDYPELVDLIDFTN